MFSVLGFTLPQYKTPTMLLSAGLSVRVLWHLIMTRPHVIHASSPGECSAAVSSHVMSRSFSVNSDATCRFGCLMQCNATAVTTCMHRGFPCRAAGIGQHPVRKAAGYPTGGVLPHAHSGVHPLVLPSPGGLHLFGHYVVHHPLLRPRC